MTRPCSVPLPIPPHYMRAAEQQQVRRMTGPLGRPKGDHRSAETIIEQSTVLRRFLETRDHYEIGDNLKLQVGDWTADNPDPQARADAAYDLDKVLRFIDNADDRFLNCSQSRNGRVDGFFSSGYGTVINSEAGVLKAFSNAGYDALRALRT
ncbi:hypothetical protein [Pseudomonas orientalis]|uniref:Uncharacterized protein n=1 Tax=Pseudomonas orientalis TaxID=76758 RepID=A0A1H2EEN7_9PSED|nr:hypothetical protein [Pseudomonas orientalis]KRP63619.1 hypothetical protein TU82_21480 [Pseudomonas orientalis]SDT93463.1 hypothetical protein SAMN04490197_1099 [Pseudomonas orientalis]